MEIMQEFLQQLVYMRHMIKHKRIHKHDGLPWMNPNPNKKKKTGEGLTLRQQDTIGRDVATTAFTNNSQSKRAYPSNWVSPQVY